MAYNPEIQNLIDSTDIVSLVEESGIELTKQGKNYRGLCPFHNEDTPSFTVNPEKKLAYCFGCHGGGDPISFIMQLKNMDYKDAINYLAKRNGITLKAYQASDKPDPNKKYYEIMNIAKDYFVMNLEKTDQGKEALEYLHNRGLDDETIKTFGIGLNSFTRDGLYQTLKGNGYLEIDAMECGLILKSNDDSYYDFFTKRISFPISDEKGNIVAFSCRKFHKSDTQDNKYSNSTDTVIFKKGDTVYNLNLAKGEILRKKRVVLYEGQMDVIASYRSGIKEAICSLSTNLTDNHVSLIKKYTNNVIICYDADKAGIAASLRAIKMFSKQGFIIHLVLLPKGLDPDEYVKQYGKEAYWQYFESHIIDANEYVFDQAILDKNLSDQTVVEAVKSEVFDMILRSGSKTVLENYARRLSEVLGYSAEAITADYYNYINAHSNTDYNNKFITNVNTKPVKEELPSKYELRLINYAKSSRELAFKIDRLLYDKMDALSAKSQCLWLSLINDYYEKYAEFSEKVFVGLIKNTDTELYYSKINDALSRDKTPYTESDLDDCLKKLDLVKYDKRNDKLSKKISTNNNLDEQLKLIQEKFDNKKKKEDLMQKGRK